MSRQKLASSNGARGDMTVGMRWKVNSEVINWVMLIEMM